MDDNGIKHLLCFLAALLILGFVLALFVIPSCDSYAGEPNEFAQGVDYGRSFLKPKKKKGEKYHRGLQKMHDNWGPWIWRYARYEYVPFLSRCWLESRGNPWSHTKDTMLGEAGLTSATYNDARAICEEHGVCGDPCGDPQLSIAISAYRRYKQHTNMLTATKADGTPTFWSSWLPEQCEDNYYECRAWMGICGSYNGAKVRKLIKRADASRDVLTKKGKDGKLHSWWYTMNFARSLSNEQILSILAPLPKSKSLWRIGTKFGRTMAGLDQRALYFEEHEDGSDNHCWIEEPWYPHETKAVTDPETGVVSMEMVPAFPEPLVPWTIEKYPKKSEWRDRCVFYGAKKKWKKSWGPPKKGEKYKTTGCVTKNGIQTCWKKGLKFPTEQDWIDAVAAWEDEQQAEGRLPTDEEYAELPGLMAAGGCPFRYVVQ